MSEVYLGRDPESRDLIVLKRLPPKHQDRPQMRKMFSDEARISRLVSGHKNIVRYLDEGELDGSPYIAFELVEGLTVAEILARANNQEQRVPPPVAIHIAIGALDALSHAHAAKDDDGKPLDLIHRDVTPQNIVLTWEGDVKLLDFGVSKSSGRTMVTAPGLIKGKPYFMAPEQLRVEDVDHRIDLFALGVVLYFLLTLRHPFEGHEDLSVLTAMIEGRIRSPKQIVPELPDSLCQDVLRALCHDADDRFATAEEMKEALLTNSVGPASPEDVMMFLSELGESTTKRSLALAPSLSGDESWHAFQLDDSGDREAVDVISMPYRPREGRGSQDIQGEAEAEASDRAARLPAFPTKKPPEQLVLPEEPPASPPPEPEPPQQVELQYTPPTELELIPEPPEPRSISADVDIPAPEPRSISADLDVPEPEPRSISADLDVPEPAAPAPAPSAPPPAPRAEPTAPVTRPTGDVPLVEPAAPLLYRAVWGLVWLLAGVLAATWLLRLLAMTAPPALVVESAPMGAQVFIDGQPTIERTPLVLDEWPGTGSVVIRWTLPGHQPCRTVLEPVPDQTVRAQCRLLRTP